MKKLLSFLLSGFLAFNALATAPAFAASTGTTFDTDTKLMMHMDASFNDVSTTAHTMTLAGSTQPAISSAQSVFGGASGLWGGTFSAGGNANTSIQAGDQIGTGAFTFDTRIYFTTLNPVAGFQPAIFGYGSSVTNANSFTVSWYSVTNQLYIYDGGVGGNVKTFSWTPTVNTWYHLAYVRDGSGNLYAFIDGTQIGSTLASTTNLTGNSGSMYLGVEAGGSLGISYFLGYLDETRLVVGTAVWTSNFTPPSAAYTAPSSSKLALLGVG